MKPLWMYVLRYFVPWLRAFISTLKDPEKMSREETRAAMRLIRRLAIKQGFSSRFSRRAPLTESEVLKSPDERGIYRLYLDERLIYIGGSCLSIRSRILAQQKAVGSKDTSADNLLMATLRTGSSEFDWLATPFAGWVEEFYIHKFEEETGAMPECNLQMRSNLMNRCLY